MVARIGKRLFPFIGSGRADWWLTTSSAQLDFVNRRYFWNGSVRAQSDFATFSLSGTASHGAAGLVLGGVAADFDITITMAALGLSFPCALIASFTPASVSINQSAASIDIDTSNYVRVGLFSANRSTTVFTAAASVADIQIAGAAIGTRTTVGANFETNNILQSLDGSTGGGPDISAALFSPTTLRIGERPASQTPANGTIHHVVLASGAQTQAQLNALCAAVHALPVA